MRKESVNISLAIIILLSILAIGCAKQTRPELVSVEVGYDSTDASYVDCNSDEDCICKGVHPDKQMCYIGNKEYYDKFVDKDEECPADDFCTGPDGSLKIRCIGGICMQFPECSFDDECGAGGRCVKNKCL